MAVLPIVKFPDPVLRKKAEPVTKFDDSLRTLVQDMIDTMRSASGVGLAAPQVGVSLKVFIADEHRSGESNTVIVVVNPEIITFSGKMVYEEGCLSAPAVGAEVERPEKIVVKGFDECGKEIEIEAIGFLARIFQHEIDHLNGSLFFDRLSKIKRDILLRKYRKTRKKDE